MTRADPPRPSLSPYAFALTEGVVFARLRAAATDLDDPATAVHDLLENRRDLIGFVARSGNARLMVQACRAVLCLADEQEQADVCAELLLPDQPAEPGQPAALECMAEALDAATLAWVAHEPLRCLPGEAWAEAMARLATAEATLRVMRDGSADDVADWIGTARYLPPDGYRAVLSELVSTPGTLGRVAACGRCAPIGDVAVALTNAPPELRDPALVWLLTDKAFEALVDSGGFPESTVQVLWAVGHLPPEPGLVLVRRLLVPEVVQELVQHASGAQLGSVVGPAMALPLRDFRAILGPVYTSSRALQAVATSDDPLAICQAVVGALHMSEDMRSPALECLLTPDAVETLSREGHVAAIGWAAEAATYLPPGARERVAMGLLTPASVRAALASGDARTRAQVTLLLTHMPVEAQWGTLTRPWSRDAVERLAGAGDPDVIGLAALAAARLPPGHREGILSSLLIDANVSAAAERGSARSIGQVAFALAHAGSVFRGRSFARLLTPRAVQAVRAGDPEDVGRLVVAMRCLSPRTGEAALDGLLTDEVLLGVAAQGGALSIVQVAQGIEALPAHPLRAERCAALLSDRAIDTVLATGEVEHVATLAASATALPPPRRETVLACLLPDATLDALAASGGAVALARAAMGAACLPVPRCTVALGRLLTTEAVTCVEASQHAPSIAAVAAACAALPADSQAPVSRCLFTPRAIAAVVMERDPVLTGRMRAGIQALPEPMQGEAMALFGLESALAQRDATQRERAVLAVLEADGQVGRIAASGNPALVARACDAAAALERPAARDRACRALLTDDVIRLAGTSPDAGLVGRVAWAAAGLQPGSSRNAVLLAVLSPGNLKRVAASGDPTALQHVGHCIGELPEPHRGEARARLLLETARAQPRHFPSGEAGGAAPRSLPPPGPAP